MGSVTVLCTLKIAGKTYKVKSVNNFFSALKDSYIRGSTEQIRALAYAGKDYLVDKLLSSVPKPERVFIYRQEALNKNNADPEFQKLNESSKEGTGKKIVLFRESKVPLQSRSPFILKELNKKYLERKAKAGLDTRILIATGRYIESICVKRKVTANTKDIFYTITVPRKLVPNTSITYNKLAKIHEFGTSSYSIVHKNLDGTLTRTRIKLPARPHWRPLLATLTDVLSKFGNYLGSKKLTEEISKLV
jgi:hypothetical protein